MRHVFLPQKDRPPVIIVLHVEGAFVAKSASETISEHFFHVLTSCLSISSSNSITHNVQRVHIDWSKVSPDDVDIYCSQLSQSIGVLLTTVWDCSVADCSVHRDILDSYARNIIP